MEKRKSRSSLGEAKHGLHCLLGRPRRGEEIGAKIRRSRVTHQIRCMVGRRTVREQKTPGEMSLECLWNRETASVPAAKNRARVDSAVRNCGSQ